MRAHTTKATKIARIGSAAVRTVGTVILPKSPVIYARPLDEVKFLVEAASYVSPELLPSRAAAFVDIMATLKARDQSGVAAE
jgi:phytoene synthase